MIYSGFVLILSALTLILASEAAKVKQNLLMQCLKFCS
jgi:hypothetical protein